MLYISRYDGYSDYGVVDTDDGCEDIVPVKSIEEYCMKLGIEIAGVDTYVFDPAPGFLKALNVIPQSMPSGDVRRVRDILVYQPPEKLTVAQTKLKVMSGIDLFIHGNGIITNLRWKKPIGKATIRLSDYGSYLGDRFLYGSNMLCNHAFTLVFDDKLSFKDTALRYDGYNGRHSLIGPGGLGLVFDLREVNDDVAFLIYKNLFPQRVANIHLPDFMKDIVDVRGRADRMLRRLWD